MKVILCGYNWCGCKAIDILISQGHEVYVFTHENPYHVPSVINMCNKNGIDYSLNKISNSELPFAPDIICSIYYRHIIDRNVIDSCRGKIFNLHPSLLPKYRGCSSLTWALINNEKVAGFTYHYIDEGCDTGDILIQRSLKIEEWDTQQSLYMRAMFLSMEYFNEVFEMVARGVKGSPQTGLTSYFPRGCPYDGQIDLSWDNEKIERFIRAMNHPPLPPARLGNELIYSIDDYLTAINS